MELVHDGDIIHQIKRIKGVNFTPPRKLGDGKHIVAFMDGGVLASFIYYTIFVEDKYLMVGYSFTIPEYRGQGLNTLLRKELEKIAVKASIPKILSIPFDGANSKTILQKMGYVEDPAMGQGVYVLHLKS